MERLTERFDGWVMRKDCHGPCRTCDRCECADIYPMIDRLTAYEDTGLEPEEMLTGKELVEIACALDLLKKYQSFGPVDRFRELAQAEKDGRLVLLPCKKGDTLWSYYDYPTWGISKIAVTAVSTLDGITVINTDNYGVIEEKDIGETVFLTREEAETALKKMEEADNETD